MDKADFMALPTSGPAWENLVALANDPPGSPTSATRTIAMA